MTSVYVFGVIIVLLFVTGLVVAPLVEREPADPDAPGGAPADERREAALEALEELEFEHETGKLSDDDYRRLKNKYARAAVEARKDGEAEARERAGDPAASGPAATAGGQGACPECGADAGGAARFCSRCGAEITA